MQINNAKELEIKEDLILRLFYYLLILIDICRKQSLDPHSFPLIRPAKQNEGK